MLDWVLTTFKEYSFFAISIGSLVSEDAALVSGLLLYQSGQASFSIVTAAYCTGVVVGDAMLYGIGWLSLRTKIGWILRWSQKIQKKLEMNRSIEHLDQYLILTRFIPGSRLPSYVTAGAIEYPFLRFLAVLFIPTLIYVVFALALGKWFQKYFGNSIGSLVLLSVFIFFISTYFFRLLTFMYQHWSHLREATRIYYHYYKRKLSFEYFPELLFYAPCLLASIYWSLRYGGILSPLWSNPKIHYSGLIGETKDEMEPFLKTAAGEHYLKSCFIAKENQTEAWRQAIKEIGFPMILKPNSGLRGQGIRKIMNLAESEKALEAIDYDLIAQEYCDFKKEIGIFYFRYPWNREQEIYSITRKEFPQVTGDGQSRLYDLVMKNPRYRPMSLQFWQRFYKQWFDIVPKGKNIRLVEAGNHYQGALFYRGLDLLTPKLKKRIFAICDKIPDFYVGRFDIRYSNEEDLTTLKNLKIIELNGAGAESTDIYERGLSPLIIYKKLFGQWSRIFRIGQFNRKNFPKKNYTLYSYLKDFFRLRKEISKYDLSD